jgi:hypothetical protein
MLASLFWIARRTASVVVALPWYTCPVVAPSVQSLLHHQTLGLYT